MGKMFQTTVEAKGEGLGQVKHVEASPTQPQ